MIEFISNGDKLKNHDIIIFSNNKLVLYFVNDIINNNMEIDVYNEISPYHKDNKAKFSKYNQFNFIKNIKIYKFSFKKYLIDALSEKDIHAIIPGKDIIDYYNCKIMVRGDKFA